MTKYQGGHVTHMISNGLIFSLEKGISVVKEHESWCLSKKRETDLFCWSSSYNNVGLHSGVNCVCLNKLMASAFLIESSSLPHRRSLILTILECQSCRVFSCETHLNNIVLLDIPLVSVVVIVGF
jgi:hypothetical protein